MKIKFQQKNKQMTAFTLLEVVVILFVVSVGVMAIMSLMIRSVNFQSSKKSLMTAVFLANEGLDLMTNIRDTNLILGNDYDDWDAQGSAGEGEFHYIVDYYTLLASSTNSIDEARLQQDQNGFFRHDADSLDSIFSRLITINTEAGESQVESWVRWQSRGSVFDYKISVFLYDLSF